jgi:integrase
MNITGDAVARYIAHRQSEQAANGTINRELGVLLRMLRLAYEHNKLLRLPIVHKPKEAPPRQGFFEVDQYDAVRRRLPEDLQVAAAIAYTCGWRTQSEVLTLNRSQVDLDRGTIRLEPGMTKDDEGREVYMTPTSSAWWRGRSSACGYWSASSSASSRSCSRISASGSLVSSAGTTAEPGRPRARRPA